MYYNLGMGKLHRDLRPKHWDFRPRLVDRMIIGTLAVLHVASGIYLSGPWYLTVSDGAAAPLMALFNSPLAVVVYGGLLLLDGVVLFYAATGGKHKHYTVIVEYALLSGFLLRLYSTIGVLLTIESWRPPNYLSQMATVFILAALWVYVKVVQREGPVR